ncbi:GvpL/GvpF family gas vesicle protein [Streptomyces chattanoogensis]|uniref:Gas vesicle protein n=1 Tax=Streptomyces chattanoogensis TaxID=66876 RepID=A0A0N0GX83_9ACTN|nr:GvpL/GvpF family gas vesicle protein [Streptomyces chattanoogensis]KPC60821.1 gas vesicle protein [Streptomyces chattanoogensis]
MTETDSHDTISYAYAVARDADGALEDALAGLPGVADAPVRLVRTAQQADVVVAVGPVPAQDFLEDALRAHLEDLDWLESVARAHHRVIEALAARTTVLPLRLATVYLDDERVRLMLETRRQAFADRLSALEAQVEWGVKIFVEAAETSEAAEAARQPDEPPPDAGLSPGRAYLSRRRAQRHARDDAYRDAERAARRVEDAARAHAVDRVQHRPQQGELARGPGENVVNDAYLVPREHAESFHADVLRAAEGIPGVRIEITGPWAPYSFATPADAEPLERATP